MFLKCFFQIGSAYFQGKTEECISDAFQGFTRLNKWYLVAQENSVCKADFHEFKNCSGCTRLVQITNSQLC